MVLAYLVAAPNAMTISSLRLARPGRERECCRAGGLTAPIAAGDGWLREHDEDAAGQGRGHYKGNADGFTPLLAAAFNGSAEIVRIADRERRDVNGSRQAGPHALDGRRRSRSRWIA